MCKSSSYAIRIAVAINQLSESIPEVKNDAVEILTISRPSPCSRIARCFPERQNLKRLDKPDLNQPFHECPPDHLVREFEQSGVDRGKNDSGRDGEDASEEDRTSFASVGGCVKAGIEYVGEDVQLCVMAEQKQRFKINNWLSIRDEKGQAYNSNKAYTCCSSNRPAPKGSSHP